MTKRLLYCGLVTGPLFVLAFLLEGATKGNGYEALRRPVSSLALGEHGWTQTANFLQGRVWAVYSVVSAVAFLVAFFLASAGFSQEAGLVEVAGLFQRLAVVIGWGWLAALAWRLR